MKSIYNAEQQRKGLRCDKKDMETGASFDLYLAALVNRFGGYVEFSEEELERVKHMDIYFEPGSKYISAAATNKDLSPYDGRSAVTIHTASSHEEDTDFIYWSFTADTQGTSALSTAYIYVPDVLTDGQRIQYISDHLEKEKKKKTEYIEQNLHYSYLLQLKKIGKLDYLDKRHLEEIEAWNKKETPKAEKKGFLNKILSLTTIK
ncbi:hypothetical protein CJF42_25710 [Pseudoalteromonas sp. NBT06-2]|nr:hypothetical protein CJF42_25710 [Pseudoalteromonas sp. NBT06-2]